MRKCVVVFTVMSSIVVMGQSKEDSISTFNIFLDPDECVIKLEHKHTFSQDLDTDKGLRIISTNNIPDHLTGEFPNSGNPNKIQPIESTYKIPLNPDPAKEIISGAGYSTGILFSGVELDPYTNEFFIGENGPNRDWNITALTSSVNLGLDCNNAHVQPNGKYHYHGTPSAYIDDMSTGEPEIMLLGYAADGFPIYYKYGYNDKGEIVAFESGYTLKEGKRPGDGINAPDGVYDGTYFQDYEYREGGSELDACNGRFGRTPENENEYYYVITDNFPSVPIYFKGQPSEDFKIGPPENQMSNHDRRDQHGMGGPPLAEEIMKMMDSNHDNKISESEVRGPLQEHFSHIDKNNDGFLTLEELNNHRPGRP